MYIGFSHTHSLLRYIVVVLFLLVLVLLWKGFLTKDGWKRSNDKFIKYLTILFDVQIVIGLVLYLFLSPIVQSAFHDFGSAMKDALFRFYAVEHITAMIISIVLLHIGKFKIDRKSTDEEKYKTGVIFFTISFLILFFAIPWPFYSFGMG